jgi:hypothetical protein
MVDSRREGTMAGGLVALPERVEAIEQKLDQMSRRGLSQLRGDVGRIERTLDRVLNRYLPEA